MNRFNLTLFFDNQILFFSFSLEGVLKLSDGQNYFHLIFAFFDILLKHSFILQDII